MLSGASEMGQGEAFILGVLKVLVMVLKDKPAIPHSSLVLRLKKGKTRLKYKIQMYMCVRAYACICINI